MPSSANLTPASSLLSTERVVATLANGNTVGVLASGLPVSTAQAADATSKANAAQAAAIAASQPLDADLTAYANAANATARRALINAPSKAIAVTANTTAVFGEEYEVFASAPFTDPTPPQEGGYIVRVRNGTATIGSDSFTEGEWWRVWHSGGWTTVRSGFTAATPAAARTALGVAYATTDESIAGTVGDKVVSPTTQKAALDPRVAGTLAAVSLAFDGTTGALISPAIGAVGTSDFTFSCWFQRLSVVPGSDSYPLWSTLSGGLRILYRNGVGFLWTVTSGTVFEVAYTALFDSGFLTLRRLSGVTTVFLNGAAIGSTADTLNITGGSNFLSPDVPGDSLKAIARAAFINCALTDAEIAALHSKLGVLPPELQHGVIGVNSGAWTTPGGDPFTTFTGVSAGGFTAAGATAGRANSTNFSLRKGQRVRVSFTATVTVGPIVVALSSSNLSGEISAATTVASGANSFELVATSESPSGLANIVFRPASGGATNFAVSGFVGDVLGALYIQPDADKGAGPVLRGPYGLPDTTLPGDGHTSGGVVRSMAGERGVISVTRTTDGYLIGDHAIIPEGYAIESVSFVGDDSVTLGESSGSPDNVVSSATATDYDLAAPVLPLVGVTSNRKLYLAQASESVPCTVTVNISRR